VPAELRVVAGISLGGQSPAFNRPLSVIVTPSGAVATSPITLSTDATGTTTTSLTPVGGVDLGASLHTCIQAPASNYLSLADVCADRNVSSSPGPVYANDFTGAAGPAWSVQTVSQSPNGERFLGVFQNTTVTLTVGSLPSHSRLRIDFDLYAIDTWDGNHPAFGPDIFTGAVQNGPTLVRTTFSNVKQPGYEQSYPSTYPNGSAPAGNGAAVNVLGYPPENGNADGFLGDSRYLLSYTFDHTGPTVAIQFTVNANTGGTEDERWGIDNVRVTVVE
jgi:hypothetical protein